MIVASAFFISTGYGTERVKKGLQAGLVAGVGKSGGIADFEIVEVALFEMLKQPDDGGMGQIARTICLGREP